MNQRLCHDCALMMAVHCVELLGGLLREDEKMDARDEFYRICNAGLEAFCIQQERLTQRLNPLDN